VGSFDVQGGSGYYSWTGFEGTVLTVSEGATSVNVVDFVTSTASWQNRATFSLSGQNSLPGGAVVELVITVTDLVWGTQASFQTVLESTDRILPIINNKTAVDYRSKAVDGVFRFNATEGGPIEYAINAIGVLAVRTERRCTVVTTTTSTRMLRGRREVSEHTTSRLTLLGRNEVSAQDSVRSLARRQTETTIAPISSAPTSYAPTIAPTTFGPTMAPTAPTSAPTSAPTISPGIAACSTNSTSRWLEAFNASCPALFLTPPGDSAVYAHICIPECSAVLSRSHPDYTPDVDVCIEYLYVTDVGATEDFDGQYTVHNLTIGAYEAYTASTIVDAMFEYPTMCKAPINRVPGGLVLNSSTCELSGELENNGPWMPNVLEPTGESPNEFLFVITIEASNDTAFPTAWTTAVNVSILLRVFSPLQIEYVFV
jgi:hypothetical protein